METLEEIVRRLLRATNDITANAVLDKFDLTKCREIDERSATDPLIRERRMTCLANLRQCGIAYSPLYKTAFDAYNEIIVYDLLKLKGNIRFQNTGSDPSPDFIWMTKEGTELNIDLKTLSYNNDTKNFKDIQAQSVDSKISIETQLKDTKHKRTDGKISVVFGEPVIYSPFKKGNNNELIDSAFVIETFIDKIQNNYKPRQLSYGGREGILLIDTRLIGHPIWLQEALPIYLYPQFNEPKSGCLWNACFGSQDHPTYDSVEFEGKPNIGRPLAKNGVMTGDTGPQAIIFIIHPGNESHFVGLYHSQRQSDNIVTLLNELCKFTNDESNSMFWEISIGPLNEYRFPPPASTEQDSQF